LEDKTGVDLTMTMAEEEELKKEYASLINEDKNRYME
jgi:hypothetical protein